MSVVFVGRSAAHPAHVIPSTHHAGRHRKVPDRPDLGRKPVERLFAIETAYLAAFVGALSLALRLPEAAAVLCGLGGVTARTAGREASRLTGRLWDQVHRDQAHHDQTGHVHDPHREQPTGPGGS